MDSKQLTKRIVIGMVLGILVGLGLKYIPINTYVNDYLINGLLDIIGRIFIISMKMLVVPLVLVSLICGVSAIGSPKKLGSIGLKTLVLYLCTTAIAITLALIFASLFHVGHGADLQTASTFHPKTPDSFADIFVNLFPANPFKALSDGNVLQIIIFAILMGIAINMAGESGKKIKALFENLNDVMMQFVMILIRMAPYGVFCLLARLIYTLPLDKIVYLLGYFLTVIFVLAVHFVFTNTILISALARMNPIRFFKEMIPTIAFAFSTSSSNATIPVNLEITEKRLGVANKIASFTIPFGATINMDGTAIMQGVATVFIANAYNIHIGLTGYLMVILTATLSSVGTAGVPGVGLITLVMVLQQVGLPVEGIALIIGVDRLLDMIRTAVNVTGDAAVSCVVAKSEGCLNLKK